MLSKAATASFDALRLLRMGIVLTLCCFFTVVQDENTIENSSSDVVC
jgi:hypothetical protein